MANGRIIRPRTQEGWDLLVPGRKPRGKLELNLNHPFARNASSFVDFSPHISGLKTGISGPSFYDFVPGREWTADFSRGQGMDLMQYGEISGEPVFKRTDLDGEGVCYKSNLIGHSQNTPFIIILRDASLLSVASQGHFSIGETYEDGYPFFMFRQSSTDASKRHVYLHPSYHTVPGTFATGKLYTYIFMHDGANNFSIWDSQAKTWVDISWSQANVSANDCYWLGSSFNLQHPIALSFFYASHGWIPSKEEAVEFALNPRAALRPANDTPFLYSIPTAPQPQTKKRLVNRPRTQEGWELLTPHRKPASRVQLNKRHPLAEGLVVAAPFIGSDLVNLVNGQRGEVTGTIGSSVKDGEIVRTSSSSSDVVVFDCPLPRSGEMTIMAGVYTNNNTQATRKRAYRAAGAATVLGWDFFDYASPVTRHSDGSYPVLEPTGRLSQTVGKVYQITQTHSSSNVNANYIDGDEYVGYTIGSTFELYEDITQLYVLNSGSLYPLLGGCLYIYAWNRVLRPDEINALKNAPFSILEPANSTPFLYAIPSSATVTLSSPTATATGSTTWSGSCDVTYT